MELEHAFQQSGFLVAVQIMVIGSALAPVAMGNATLYHKFVRDLASWVVSFGPLAVLVYVLYKVSRMS